MLHFCSNDQICRLCRQKFVSPKMHSSFHTWRDNALLHTDVLSYYVIEGNWKITLSDKPHLVYRIWILFSFWKEIKPAQLYLIFWKYVLNIHNGPPTDKRSPFYIRFNNLTELELLKYLYSTVWYEICWMRNITEKHHISLIFDEKHKQ